jgi:hypothetical protein
MRPLVLLLICLINPFFIFSQGTVRGKITDEKGESLIGVTVTLKSNKLVGVFTDFDGNYSIKIPDALPQTLIVSYVSYSNIQDNVSALKDNEVLIKNYTMSSSETALQEVEVVAKQVRANEYFMENIKKNSATTIDYISSATMKKTGDANVAAAVARVSGVSVTSSGLITVRGMSDRYVKTTFNGSIIPTLDPLTNNIQLDMFPSSLIDNVIFTKTASPDLRGDWAGAYISVETKDYPEKLTVNIETQLGYNQQTTFKNVISSERSSTDWLGYDNGLRERDQKHSEFNLPGLDNIGNVITTSYQEMIALGLSDYYNSLGVTNFNESSIYFNLGLVQLGLLQPALIDNQAAINAASLEYRTNYKPKAFKLLYPDGTDYNNQFANNWDTQKRRAPLNYSQSFGIGNQTTLFGKPLGYIFGFRYGTSTRYDQNARSNRFNFFNGTIIEKENVDNVEIGRETNGWSALYNLSYKLTGNNTVSFLFMPNQTGTNDVVHFSSTFDDGEIGYPNTKTQFYEQRRQNIYQFKSENFIPKGKIKLDLNASYTKGKSNVPDFKVVNYGLVTQTSGLSGLGPTVGEGIKRFYRYLNEDILDVRLSAELPISNSIKAGVRKIKFGAAYEEANRKSENYGYLINNGNDPDRLSSASTISELLSTDNFLMQDGKLGYSYAPSGPDNNYRLGMSVIKSAFAMIDYSIISSLRVSGGLRIEKTNVFTNINTYYDNYEYTKNNLRTERDSGEINEVNYLPSINLIYKAVDNKKIIINVRLNYSQTLARPTIRELSNYRIYDNEFRNGFVGNANLKIAETKNYDLRLESYFKNGDNLSISLFHKSIKNNIEMAFGGGDGITWINVDTTIVSGIEFEGKKNIGKHFELKTNITLVKSQTKYTTTVGNFNRTMFGQAPFILNGMLVYKADSIGLTATIAYNVQGSKLVIINFLPTNAFVYELPRHVIDIKISKTLGKHFAASFSVRDLLNAPIRREYRTSEGKRLEAVNGLDFDKFRYGTNFILGVSYKL